MRLTYFLIVLGITILYLVYRRTGLIPKKDAADLLKKGALVIDVRTPAEFYSGHLSQAYNMPLDEVENLVSNKVRDRGKVMLLHCQSGFRARTAKARLEALGYKNVFVLGSYERAFKIVSGRSL
ncbi:MAG TPA: rhodanese-like domain-containing protein [Terracidiphilus sp.]|nr:rhodanese-like domain-containing protein [Terracidiphilus sp.]